MIYARSKIGTPQPPATRPRLSGITVLLAHHVGVNTPKPDGRYRSADPARVLDDARAIAAYGIGAGVTWEYNYLIGLNGDIFEQAGTYRAAHCLNFNDRSIGVLFICANDVPASAAQVDAWRRLRAHLVAERVLVAEHIVAPHYRYRSTACCGIRAEAPGASWGSPTGQGRLGNLIPALAAPYQTVPPVPPPVLPLPPPIIGDVDMLILWRDERYQQVFLIGGGPATNVSGAVMAYYQAAGVAYIEERHDGLLTSCVHQSGVTLTPINVA